MTETKHLLRVNTYDSSSGKTKQKTTLSLPTSFDKDKVQLDAIRAILTSNGVLNSKGVHSPFCTSSGAEMSDSTDFHAYLEQLKENDDEVNTNADDTNLSMHQVIVKKRKMLTEVNDDVKEFLKKEIDYHVKEFPELKGVKLDLLQSAFQASDWQATPGGELILAANMNEREWSSVTRGNSLVNGHRLVRLPESKTIIPDKNVKPKHAEPKHVVERSQYNAFRLKKRRFRNSEISAPANQAAPSQGANTSHEANEMSFRIPWFVVDDASSVRVIETQTMLEESMAKSSFSNTSLEAGLGGGFWGVSAAAKGGFEKKTELDQGGGTQKKLGNMHVSYNFPRVTVFLDPSTLEVTRACARDLRKVTSTETLEWFGTKYGHVFARKVTLGGKLMSTHKTEGKSKDSKKSQADRLKIAASVSVSGAAWGVSADFSNETGNKTHEEESRSTLASKMTWEAFGGNTTLCNNPPEWIKSMNSFRSWRVIEQGDFIPLHQAIGAVKGFEHIPADFSKIYDPMNDKVQQGCRLRKRIRLTYHDGITEQALVVSAGKTRNPLETYLSSLLSTPEGGSISLGDPLRVILNQIAGGGVYLADPTTIPKEDDLLIMDYWVHPGETVKYMLGSNTCCCTLYKEEMPVGFRTLGVVGPMRTEPANFLYPGAEAGGALFVLQAAGGTHKEQGQWELEDGDLVEVRVRDEGNGEDLGWLVQTNMPPAGKEEKNNSAGTLVGIGPRGGKGGAHHDKPVTVLKFKVEIFNTWQV